MAETTRSGGLDLARHGRARGGLIARRAAVASAVATLILVSITATFGLAAVTSWAMLAGLTSVIAVGTLATLYRPRAAVPALVFLLFIRLSDYVGPQDGPVSINQVAVGLFLGATLLHHLVLDREPLRWDRVLGWMLAYGTAIALSAVAAYNRVTTLAALMAYVREALIAFVLVNLVTTTAGLQRTSWGLVTGGAFLAAAAVLHVVTGYDFGGLSSLGTQAQGDSSAVRLDGPVGIDNNYFAQLLVTALPLALYRAWDERRLILRVAALGALTVACGVIVWTFSRGGFIASLAVLGIAAAMQRFNRRRMLTLGLALAVVVLATPRLYWDRIGLTAQYVAARTPGLSSGRETLHSAPGQHAASPSSSADTVGSSGDQGFASPAAGAAATSTSESDTQAAVPRDGSLDARAVVWRVGALMFLEHPVTGIGKGNYYLAYPDYFWRVDPSLSPGPTATHNTPAQLAAETGLAGLATFAGVVIVATTGLRSAKRRCARAGLRQQAMLLEAIEVAIYGYLVTSLFLHDNTYQRYLWLLIGLAAAGHRIASQPANPALPATERPARTTGPA